MKNSIPLHVQNLQIAIMKTHNRKYNRDFKFGIYIHFVISRKICYIDFENFPNFAMFVVKMNAPLVSFQYFDLEVLHILYSQTDPDFPKSITQTRNYFFSDFCII